MHVFIHGDRGVGKTSLALTAAAELTGPEPAAYVGCDGAISFAKIIRDICDAVLKTSYISTGLRTEHSGGFNLGVIKYDGKVSGSSEYSLPTEIETINQAASLIDEAMKISKRLYPVIIIDEFDRIANDKVREQFSELIKRLHDKKSQIHLLFCGIGRDVETLIGKHLSSGRALHTVEIGPISHDARWLIVSTAADALGFEVNREYIVRIGRISDGFPYYVHLITKYLMWEIYSHWSESVVATSDDYHRAVSIAMEHAENALKSAYKYAIQKTAGSVDYEEALWSVADGRHLERQLKEIYDNSYKRIAEAREDGKPIEYERFRGRLYRLCKDSHGTILSKKQNSWYYFTESVMRGYVRLVAARNRIDLGPDHH